IGGGFSGQQLVPVAEGGWGGDADAGKGDHAGNIGVAGEGYVCDGLDDLPAIRTEDRAAEEKQRDVRADLGCEFQANILAEVEVHLSLETEEGCGGVGRTGSHSALDGQVFLDVNIDVCGPAELREGLFDHLPGGVAAVAGDSWVVGAENDACLAGGGGGDGDDVVEGQGLVEGGEGMEAVRPRRAYGQAADVD